MRIRLDIEKKDEERENSEKELRNTIKEELMRTRLR